MYSLLDVSFGFHSGWTSRLSSTDLITDRRAGIEVIETIQAFLDNRNASLPDHIRSARQEKLRDDESQQSEFGSMGIEFTREDLMMLGEDTGTFDIVVENEKALAEASLFCRLAGVCICADGTSAFCFLDYCQSYLSRYLRTSFEYILFQRGCSGRWTRYRRQANLDIKTFEVLGRLRKCPCG
jgi:hypothetical protein